MPEAKPRRPVRGDEASICDRGIAQKLFQDQTSRNALASRIHAAIVETARHRSLTQLEVRIRCMTAPRPWRDAGVSPSTFYRRRARARVGATEVVQ